MNFPENLILVSLFIPKVHILEYSLKLFIVLEIFEHHIKNDDETLNELVLTKYHFLS